MSIELMKQALAALDDVLQLSAEHSEVRAALRLAIDQHNMASEPEVVKAEYKLKTYAAYTDNGELKIGELP